MVTTKRKKQTALDQLVEEFYKVKGDISLLGYHSTTKAKALSERKHEIMWDLN